MSSLRELKGHPAFRTVMLFIILLCLAAILIMLGRRNDAVTQAMRYHAGVLSADKVNQAFENVGGRLVARRVNESDAVKKGDVLLEIDERDTLLNLNQLRASLDAQDAQIRQQETDIENEYSNLELTRQQTWHKIEELGAQVEGAVAAEAVAEAEYNRYSALRQSSNVSASAYDTARNAYLQARAQRMALLSSIKELTLGATPQQVERLKTQGLADGMTLSAIEQRRSEIENHKNALAALKAARAATAAQIELVKLNLSRTKLYAAQDGRVLEVMFEEGEIVPPSSTAVLLETDRYYYDVYLSEVSAALYKPGDTVTGRVPALGTEVEGTVRFVDAAASFADLRMTREQGQADLTSFKMRIYTKPLAGLKPGMTVEIADRGEEK